jgi:hypothetical protein
MVSTNWPSNNNSSKRKRSTKSTAVITLGIVAVVWILVVVVWSHSVLDANPTHSSREKVVVGPAAVAEFHRIRLLEDLWPNNYQDESLFQAISHSCDEACHPEKRPSLKVAILFFPGRIGSIFVDFIKECVRLHFDKDNKDGDMMVVPTSHIPSNGGDFTHIIRFVNLPLLLAVGDALLSVSDGKDFTLDDVQQVTQLILNWHCELSQLADSHTIPLFTVTMEELIEEPDEVELDLREFVTALDPFEEMNSMDYDELEKNLSNLVHKIEASLEQLEERSSKGGGKNSIVVEILVEDLATHFLKGGTACPNDINKKGDNLLLSLTGATSSSSLANQFLPFVAPSYHGATNAQTMCVDPNHPLSKKDICLDLLMIPFSAKQLASSQRKVQHDDDDDDDVPVDGEAVEVVEEEINE